MVLSGFETTMLMLIPIVVFTVVVAAPSTTSKDNGSLV